MPETLQALGKAAFLAGNTVLAEKSWIRQLTIENEGPMAAQAHFDLASLYRTQGKRTQAEKEMEEFKRLRGHP